MKKILLPAVLLFTATTVFAQKVTNQLYFPKGAKIEVTTTITNVAELMGEITTSATTSRVLDVEDVKEGIATIESKIKRMQFSFEGMGQSQSFDSENESDMKGEGGKMAEKALKNKYKMRVDNFGNIMDVIPDDDNPNKSEKEVPTDPMMGMMEGVMGGVELPKSGDKMEFAIMPNKDLAKGDSWTDNTSKIKELQRKATYTISNITEDNIVIDFTEETAGKLTRQNMGMDFHIDQQDKSTGQIIIDKKTGLLKERNVTKQTTGTMEVMGQTMPLSSKTTIKEVVTVQ